MLLDAVRGITELIQIPGEINVDFADVRSIMSNAGPALMGTGWGEGEQRAVTAAQHAIASPLLEDVGVDGATGILMNITGGPDLKLIEVSQAAELIEDAADEDVNLIYGQVIDPEMSDQVKVTVIATGFAHAQVQTDAPQQLESRLVRPVTMRPTHFRAPAERPLSRALQRRSEVPEPMPSKSMVHARPPSSHAIFNEAEIDIPTFIRKQTE